jgi:galactokinase
MQQDKLTDMFYGLFHQAPLLVKSPGRVNLIGEHTSYNEGFVLRSNRQYCLYRCVTQNG